MNHSAYKRVRYERERERRGEKSKTDETRRRKMR
jgi:hypothetical protein